ncbi:SDR family oxidoreductase [Saccharibacillus sp. CPCC 101409]|uniref:SDR family NAD(P)-dependent oxidoreductase n=1 Tax=Saccharibacillus sp. CPCC 101409 TaxID=3058041 RepID=UPI0026731744|nr:SDR family oxidoreductase [Saccharibacillus sp. CPCC 101409]MDO3409339.1 SDR family oxidoreductase [Saccharibacillus sp. CPCC 101409]
MELGLKDKVVVVTGASSGIGLATAKLFLEEGAKVAGASRHPAKIRELGGEDVVLAVEADLSTAEGPKKLIEAAVAKFGRIDILINNAGISHSRLDGFLGTTDEQWAETYHNNLMSMVRTSRAAIPHMVDRGKGVIISIASEDARQPQPMSVDYSAFKAGLLSVGKALSFEFGPKGVRVNTVSPGPTHTNIWDRPGGMIDAISEKFGKPKDEVIDFFVDEVRELPVGRIGLPEDIAAMVVFLSSDKAEYAFGAEYPVNGGSFKGM